MPCPFLIPTNNQPSLKLYKNPPSVDFWCPWKLEPVIIFPRFYTNRVPKVTQGCGDDMSQAFTPQLLVLKGRTWIASCHQFCGSESKRRMFHF